ncbi:hypothetical protein VSH64_14040 [Amycolatopsis rhabdoformis]|uniref:DUF4375 domain-containing protein n=1 Tax=Amycolatopsis rhabdoformis TaxID=1448059 RepID=A0ABZ1IIH9_9PSEU|nr:hypothetical protein [Amycolatopsis rhabdoformis]WSE33220.1 hypothetical protein VSH64_14040 [Amycolatopsis rhabdoformis]
MIKIDTDGPYHVVEHQDFVARFLIGRDDPHTTEDADVHVLLANGTRRYLTFFTLEAIGRVLARWKLSGEAGNGSYFWTSDLVIVARPGIPAMTAAIEELVRSQDIVSACQLIPGDDDDEDFLSDGQVDQIEDRAQRTDTDLDFIAQARADVLRLAAEVRRLRATPVKPTVTGTAPATRHPDS